MLLVTENALKSEIYLWADKFHSGGLSYRLKDGRDSEIRTHDLLLPKQARYQAALCPVREYSKANLINSTAAANLRKSLPFLISHARLSAWERGRLARCVVVSSLELGLKCVNLPLTDLVINWWARLNDERWRAGFYTAGETPAFPVAPALPDSVLPVLLV